MEQSQSLKLKSISDIVGEKFYVPKYQRGYRWDKTQVEALLNDIFEYEPTDSSKTYCLQPVVVANAGGKWELLDGQQRLTTIFIIISYLKVYSPKIRSFSLEYETRPNSENFLKGLSEDTDIDHSNIDFFYITSAFQTIKTWFESKKDANIIAIDFQSKLFKNAKIIWYEVGDIPLEQRIQVFTRLNIGKIPLTAAELIKALLLQEKNFTNQEGTGSKYVQHRQFEIATEWDQIENELHNESFWYFILGNENNYATRIEFLFEIIIEKDKPHNSDPLWTFLEIQKIIEKGNVGVEDIWGKVKSLHMILKDWYENHELYHYIGFLVTTGKSLKTLLTNYKKLTKTEFQKFIRQEIYGEIPQIDIKDLTYREKNHHKNIRIVLLLHNIESLVKNKSYSKFPFDQYHKKQWSLEHIHAQNSEDLRTTAHRLEWLEAHKNYLGDNFMIPKSITENEFQTLADKVYSSYNRDTLVDDQELHAISNLALLSCENNAALSNSIFPVKRAKIIEIDQKGQFIPPCTRNIFLKYYNTGSEQVNGFWSKEDKKEYFKDISETLRAFEGDKNGR